MSTSPSPAPAAQPATSSFLARALEAWNRFWFTPTDPTLLGLIRLGCGLLAVYTVVTYTWDLQTFFGRNAWLEHDMRDASRKEAPMSIDPLFRNTPQQHLLDSLGLTQKQYTDIEEHILRWTEVPSQAELAKMGLNQDQLTKFRYIDEYLRKWKQVPPLPHPRNDEEAADIHRFIETWQADPRTVFVKGSPEWSVWFHVTDPDEMMAVHAIFIVVTVMFAIGFCTRITSVLAWFAAMSYIHRSPVTLFGADTMMLILMIYCIIGPSGAAVSVDRLISRWWRRRRGELVPNDERPQPSVSANVAMRALQVHVCIIYAAAGLAKLQGNAWWVGTAVWGTLANAEFAPMQSGWYMMFLRTLTNNYLMLNLFLAAGTYFTLFFEICYAFMIWGKNTRWLMLFMAVVLHGVIGMFMGLKTFALVMLVMNMAFLPLPTVYWLLGFFRRGATGAAATPPPSEPATPVASTRKPAPVESIAATHAGGSAGTRVKPKSR